MARLKKKLRSLIGMLFWISGVPILIRRIVCRKGTTILTYHNPDPKTFEKHVRYLNKRFRFITIGELVSAIHTDDWTGIPPKSLAITLDDGYCENYRLAPIFAKYGLMPTIYVCSDVVNTNRHYWFETGLADIAALKKATWAGLLQALRESEGYQLEKEYEDRQALNYEEMKAMMRDVDFQSHSRYHPILTRCDEVQARAEIVESKKNLEALTKKNITHFSYPNGDYSDRERQELVDAGYASARTIDVGWNNGKTDPFKLKSMGIEDNASLPVLCAQVHGFFGFVKYACHGSFKGKRPPLIT